MMLEVLFARAAQRITFLRLCLCGLGVGAAVHLSCVLHRRFGVLASVWDALACVATAVAFGAVMLFSGEGVRAYGALGLAVGAALYGAGIVPLLRAVAKLWHGRKPKQAGKAKSHAEMNTQNTS